MSSENRLPDPQGFRGKKRWAAVLALAAVAAAILIAVFTGGNRAGDTTADTTARDALTATDEAATQQATETIAAPSAAPSEPPAAAPSETPAAAPSEAPAAAEPAAPPAAPPAAEPAAPGPDPAASYAQLATVEQPVAPPVDISATTAVTEGITAKVEKLEAVQGEAKGIGEIAGPAIRFTVTVTNGTAEAVPLANAIVNVSAGADDAPASQLSGPNTVAFPESVAAGGSASGTFVFSVPVEQRDSVKIYLNYSVAAPVAAFAGPAPKN